MKNLLKDISKIIITLGLLLGIGAGSVYQTFASATTLRVVQTPTVHLYLGESAVATSVRITPYPKDLDGNKLSITDFGTLPTFTVDPKVSGVEEIESFTGITDNGDNTATLTGVSRDLQSKYPYTGTGTGVQHGAGATVVFGNNPQLYGRLNSLENDQTTTGITTFNIPPILNDTNATSTAQAASRAYVLSVAFGTLPIQVVAGGTGAVTLPQMILVGNNLNAVTGSSTPYAAAYVATSTTATSTFAGGITIGKSVTVSGNEIVTGNIAAVGTITGTFVTSNLGVLGDGTDGNVTESVNTTLTQDMYAQNLTVNNGVSLNTGGFRIFATGTISVSGTIQNNGGNGGNGAAGGSGAGGTAGTAASSTIGTSTPGTAGSAGGGGVPASATSIVNSKGGKGGNGGGGGNGVGGAGGAIFPALSRLLNIVDAIRGTSFSTTTKSEYAIGGGGGGGGGDASSGNNGGGGGGGGGGGTLYIFADTITVAASGVIQANGGVGGNGGSTSGPGGGGGGGGLVYLGYKTTYTNSGTVQAAGGTHGTDAAASPASTSGSAGTVITFKLQ